METVTHMPAGHCAIVNVLPIIFLVVSVAILVLAIRYFIRLGSDVRTIRQLLEERKAQGK